MEYNRFDEYSSLADDPYISYEFFRLNKDSSYIILNRTADIEPDNSTVIPVDLDDVETYSYKILKDSNSRYASSNKLVIDEGHIVYNMRTNEISFANIHQVSGDNYRYSINYIHRLIDGKGTFLPKVVIYSDNSSVNLTMRLDKHMNILQIYNTSKPEKIESMVILSYILSNEITQLRRIADLMIHLGYIDDYVIN